MKKIIFGSLLVAIVICCAVFGLSSLSPKEKITSINIQSSYPQYDLDDLTTKADLILQGKIVDNLNPKWNNKNNKKPDKFEGKDMIIQDNILKISDVLKGQPLNKDSITIRTFGGKTSDFEIIDDSQPVFTKGEDVIVFLVYDDGIYNIEKSKDHLIVLGASQGVYKTNNGKWKNVQNQQDISEVDLKTEITKFINNPKVYQHVESIEK